MKILDLKKRDRSLGKEIVQVRTYVPYRTRTETRKITQKEASFEYVIKKAVQGE